MKLLNKFVFLLFILTNVNAMTPKIHSNYSILNNEFKIITTSENLDYQFLPNATITANATSICLNDTPPIITFTGNGGTVPYTFIYKINNGPNITLTSPGNSITINASTTIEGIFDYNLVSVTSSSFTQPINQSLIITVNPSPDTTINATGSSLFNGNPIFKICGNTPGNFTFTNTSSTTATNINYTIYWGDGSPNYTSTSWNSTSHTYTLGFWTLTYTIIGQGGCTSTKSYNVFVGSNPAVSLGNPGNTDICNTETLTFPITGTNNNPPGTTYTVTFNDGTAPQIFNHPPPASVSHSFLITSCGTTSSSGITQYPNSFSANIVAVNPCGTSAVGVVPIYVSTPPVAKFTAPLAITCTNNPVCFTNTSSGSVEVTNGGASCNSTPKTVWIITPSSGFTLNSGTVGNDFGLNDPSLWSSGSASICPKFTSPGTYSIKMRVGNRCGFDEITKTICIDAPLIPSYTLSGTEGCGPLSVSTTNTTTINNSCVPPTYLWTVTYTAANCGTAPAIWSFTNGTSATVSNPSFNFVSPGTYSIGLRMTNSCGSVNSPTQTVIVKQPPTVSILPIASMCQTLSSTSINPSASINSCSPISTNLTYTWSFMGGSPSSATTANPGTISYSNPGTYSISLTVTNECGSTVATNQSFTIKPTPTVNTISDQTKCTGAESDAITFSGTVIGTTYNWTNSNTNIGLASSGTGNINTFNLTNSGNSITTATITVTPVINGCPGISKIFTITVLPNPSVNNISNKTLCNNTNQGVINFGSPVAGTQYTWTNNNSAIGLAASGTGNIAAFTASNTGTSPITATITVIPSNTSGCTGASKTFTITVNPTPAAMVIANKEFCSGINVTSIPFANAVSGTTYSWTNSLASIGLASGGTGNIPSFTSVNPGINPLVSTITVTASSNGCPAAPQVFTITINPSPIVNFSISNQSICSGDNSALVNLTSTSSGITLNWTAQIPRGITGVTTSGTNAIPVQTLVNTTNTPIVVTYKATATYSAGITCIGSEYTYTITVKPLPYNSGSIPATICSGFTFTISPTNGSGNIIPFATTYSWGLPIVTGGITGGISGINQTSIGGTLLNPTNTPQTATYSVSPSSNGCSGQAFDVIITINPKPIVNPISDQVLCNGDSSTLVNFTGNIAGSVYNWTSNNTAIGISASGTNSVPVFIATNNGTSPIIATITVTPAANSCSGIAETFKITVNPTPTVNTIANRVICNGEASGIIPITGTVTGSTYSWTNDNPAIGLAAIGTGNIPVFNALNNSNTPIVANIVISPSANGCSGFTKSFTITINPTPTVDLPTDQEVCNGSQTQLTAFIGILINTQFNWTNSNPSIGLASSGTGDIAAFTAINSSTNPIIASITVTPILNGCNGPSKTYIITVNPTPVIVFSEGNQTICSTTSTSLVNLSSATSGSNFTWTAIQPVGISGMITSGTNQIPVQTLYNSTNSPITITYSATAQSNATVSCSSNIYTYTITVNPVPLISSTEQATICSGSVFTISPLDGGGNTVPTNTLYTWSSPVINPIGAISGATALPTPQLLSQQLTNTTDQIATATYSVSPNSGSCVGNKFNAVVTVNPSPKVVFSEASQIICSGSNTLAVALSSPTSGNVTFNWTATIPAGITGAAASGTDIIPIQSITNTSSNPINITYSATATLANGISCTGIVYNYTITVNPYIVTSNIVSNYNGFNISSSGGSDGWINTNVSGGSGTYTYSWTGPNGFIATTEDISNLSAGNYLLTLSDGICASVIIDITLSEPSEIKTQENLAAHINILCNGAATGAIKIDITQFSVGPYDYVLRLNGGGIISSNMNIAATDFSFTGLAAGTYDATVTDANGSTKTISGIIITQPNPIIASISAQTNELCFGGNNATVTVTANGGTGTLTYAWNTSPVQTSPTATGLIAGTYTVTITDTNNCIKTIPVLITQPNPITTTISSKINVDCFGNSSGSATVSANGGTGILTYSWDTNPVQTLATATGLLSGNYNVTVSDANNCSKIQSVTITEPATPLSAAITNSVSVLCFGGNTGSATVTANGGTAPYTYLWNSSPAQTLPTATGLEAGNYSVSVTDANGCSINKTITITEPTVLTAIITSQSNVFCAGNSSGSATAIASGGIAPYTYSWDTNPVQTSATAIGLSAGTYTLKVTDTNNCSTNVLVIITQPNAIITTISAKTNVDCFGNNSGSASVLASGGTGTFTYSWNTMPIQTSATAIGLSVGTYFVTVTDSNACSKIQSVTITEPAALSINTDSKKDISCFAAANGQISISVIGGTQPYTYNWTKDAAPFATSEDLSNLAPGNYEVTVSDTNNCGSIKTAYRITEPTILNLSLVSKKDIICYGSTTGAIIINASGGTPIQIAPSLFDYKYSWTGPNGFNSSNQNLSNIPAGTYLLTLTDNLGCSKNLSVTINQPTELIINATVRPIVCFGANNGRISLDIQGGITPYQIQWSTMGNGIYQDNLSPGNYQVTVTDANNCSKTISITMPEAPILEVNAIVTNVSCHDSEDGSIVLNVVSGLSPFTIVWADNPVAGNTRNNLEPGSYSVTITDARPCSITQTYVILEPQEIFINGNVTEAFGCNNANSGGINITVTGGTQPFNYLWSNGATSEDLTNVPAGNYSVSVTDSRGCKKIMEFAINRQNPLLTSVNTYTEVDCETKKVNQSFIADVSGGIPPYQLSWSSGIMSGTNNEIMSTSQNGTIILTATDNLGCSANYSFNVSIPEIGSPSFDTQSYAYSTYGIYSKKDPIQFTNTSTGDFVSISWDFGDGSVSNDANPLHTYLSEGPYVVTQSVTYPYGCVDKYIITLMIDKGYKLMVPNAFTPNLDGVNDTFVPVFEGLKTIELNVYDTWGELIYTEKGETIVGWDGIVNSKETENGNYYFRVIANTFYDEIIILNGPFVKIK